MAQTALLTLPQGVKRSRFQLLEQAGIAVQGLSPVCHWWDASHLCPVHTGADRYALSQPSFMSLGSSVIHHADHNPLQVVPEHGDRRAAVPAPPVPLVSFGAALPPQHLPVPRPFLFAEHPPGWAHLQTLHMRGRGVVTTCERRAPRRTASKVVHPRGLGWQGYCQGSASELTSALQGSMVLPNLFTQQKST